MSHMWHHDFFPPPRRPLCPTGPLGRHHRGTTDSTRMTWCSWPHLCSYLWPNPAGTWYRRPLSGGWEVRWAMQECDNQQCWRGYGDWVEILTETLFTQLTPWCCYTEGQPGRVDRTHLIATSGSWMKHLLVIKHDSGALVIQGKVGDDVVSIWLPASGGFFNSLKSSTGVSESGLGEPRTFVTNITIKQGTSTSENHLLWDWLSYIQRSHLNSYHASRVRDVFKDVRRIAKHFIIKIEFMLWPIFGTYIFLCRKLKVNYIKNLYLKI